VTNISVNKVKEDQGQRYTPCAPITVFLVGKQPTGAGDRFADVSEGAQV